MSRIIRVAIKNSLHQNKNREEVKNLLKFKNIDLSIYMHPLCERYVSDLFRFKNIRNFIPVDVSSDLVENAPKQTQSPQNICYMSNNSKK